MSPAAIVTAVCLLHAPLFFAAEEGTSRFTLIGKLPGGGHPYPCTYRVRKVESREREIHCDLEFTHVFIPGAGPSIPTDPFFVADMPSMPSGKYMIVFKTVASFRKHGAKQGDRQDGVSRAHPSEKGKTILLFDPANTRSDP